MIIKPARVGPVACFRHQVAGPISAEPGAKNTFQTSQLFAASAQRQYVSFGLPVTHFVDHDQFGNVVAVDIVGIWLEYVPVFADRWTLASKRSCRRGKSRFDQVREADVIRLLRPCIREPGCPSG